jgi:prevent-host-death family protein
MKSVNIEELRAHLSAHIQLVRGGEEVLVCDRGKPVAKVVPCRLARQSEQEQRLVAKGLLTLPVNKRPASVSWPELPGNVRDEVMRQLWREEREGR